MDQFVHVTLKGVDAYCPDVFESLLIQMNTKRIDHYLLKVPSGWITSEDLPQKLARVAYSINDWFSAYLMQEGSAGGYVVPNKIEYEILDKVDLSAPGPILDPNTIPARDEWFVANEWAFRAKWDRYFAVNEDFSWQQHVIKP